MSLTALLIFMVKPPLVVASGPKATSIVECGEQRGPTAIDCYDHHAREIGSGANICWFQCGGELLGRNRSWGHRTHRVPTLSMKRRSHATAHQSSCSPNHGWVRSGTRTNPTWKGGGPRLVNMSALQFTRCAVWD
ncbi:hypothetical protein BS78_10G087300 [Paspalum vaginatum]|nr:hypothetical protein BS78_10G087300 [Paspalum vaginatum]